MRTKKRGKWTRHAGSQTHGRGAKERTRGSGNKGGVGLSGSGKRADQKKPMVFALYGADYFGKDRALKRGKTRPKLRAMNVQQIQENLHSMIAQGIAKETKGTYEISLENYKILGEGEIKEKVKINAGAATESAMAKVKKSGGEIVIKVKKAEEDKVEVSSEKIEKRDKKKTQPKL